MTTKQATYPRGRLIAHAGGMMKGRKYSNSIEAFERSSDIVSLIEHDVCDVADGLIVAHDGMEHAYGIKGNFSDCDLQTFQRKKFVGQLRTMTVEGLLSRLPQTSASVVLDIKTTNSGDYPQALADIRDYCAQFGVLDQTIVQIYNEADFDCARDLGFPNVILALWKNFGNVWSPQCRACIDYCFQDEHAGFRALLMAARHFWKDDGFAGQALAKYAFGKSDMVFLHGQPETAERPLLELGFGLFTHNPETLSKIAAGTATGIKTA